MATKFFDCENCGGHGKIIFKEGEITSEEVVFCPFCGADIYTEEDFDEEE